MPTCQQASIGLHICRLITRLCISFSILRRQRNIETFKAQSGGYYQKVTFVEFGQELREAIK